VLGDSLLAGLRRMAHENVSRSLFPVPPEIGARYGHTATPTATPTAKDES
jgi:hypothetical protein